MILFNNFKQTYSDNKVEIDQAIRRVAESGWYILGKENELFEKNFASYLNARFCVGVANGTEAIALALMACDVESGDEVITTNLTAYPTITGIIQSGAKPVLVDISEDDGLIDPDLIEEKITKHTKAIVPVHLYGQSCNMDPILKIAEKYKLKIVEDCAQSTGAEYKSAKCGTIGNCGAFSFYPTKNLGAMGDGGAISTNDRNVYEKLLSCRNYGQTKRYYHDEKGINSRLDEIQAAILNVKLSHLDNHNEIRNQISRIYRDNLNSVTCLKLNDYGKHVNHLFVVKSKNRDGLMSHLQKNDIQSLIHYPVPVNKQKAFSGQKNEKFIHSERFADSILSIPLYPELKESEYYKIITIINEFDN